MTRVAISLDQHWNKVPGGTARAVASLVDALVANGAQILGVHGRYGQSPRVALPTSAPVEQLPFPGGVMTQMWSWTGRPKPDRFVRADVLHSPAYVLPETDLGVVATIHDLAFVRHPEWFSSRGVGYLRRFLQRVIDTEAHVIVPSHQSAADCLQAGIADDRIAIIPWGINVPEIDDAAVTQVRARYGLPERFVLYVGTLEPRKNLGGLQSSLELLKNVPLVVVGPDGWGDTEVSGIRLRSLPRHELDAVIQAATVLIYPSHFEGFGLPVLEAMAVGTPVVTTANTAPADVLGDGGLSVDTRSPAKLAEAIEAIFTDSATAEAFGTAGKLRAHTFTWERTAKDTQKVYEDARRW